MAARSATFASAATAASSVPGPAVMISGRSACRDPARQLLDRRRIGMRGTRRGARRDRGLFGQRGRQRLARQHQIHRPARRGHRHLMRARHHVGGLAGHAQLVIPLHDLAHHAGLVEHLLAPVDLARARAELALLGDRRAPGREDQRHAVAREVDQVVDRVAGADVDMHHHGLRAAGLRVGAVRHRDREILVRHQDRPRQFHITAARARKTLDDRRKVRAGIGRRKSRRRARRARGETLRPRSACVRRCLARSSLWFVIVGHVLLGPAGADNAGGARGAMNKRMGEA